MKHSHTSAIALSGNRSSRSFALGAVILLHIGLIAAIGDGLTARLAPPVLSDLKARMLEPPPVTPPVARNWQPPTTTIVTPPIDLPVVSVSSEGGPTTAITPNVPSTHPIAPPVTRSVVVPPKTDARHPLSQPAYPASARRAGAEGTVELSLFVLANGRISEAKVARSSGFSELDDAAVKEALRAWRLIPQQVDGIAVATWHNIAVTFRLKN